jgi:hypothetical protein
MSTIMSKSVNSGHRLRHSLTAFLLIYMFVLAVQFQICKSPNVMSNLYIKFSSKMPEEKM